MANLLIYFIVGFLLDMLATLDIQAVQKDQAYKSAAVSFTGTVLSYYIFYDIIIGPDFLLGLLSYALGGAVGAIITMRRKPISNFLLRIIDVNRRFLTGRYAVAKVRENTGQKNYSKVESEH